MNDSKRVLVFFLIAFLLIIPAVLSVPVSVWTKILITISGEENYLIPFVYVDQNGVKGEDKMITVQVYKQSITWLDKISLYKFSNTTANITKPNNAVDEFVFTNNDNGNYTYNYTFDLIGTYRMYVTVSNSTDGVGYSKSVSYIYIGKFPINAKIVGGTEYSSGETGEIDVYVEDDDGNPILGGEGNVTIYYPNKTEFVTDGNLTEIANGMYYYDFTVPDVEGVYTTFMNFTQGTNYDSDSKTFHVSPASNIVKNESQEYELEVSGGLYNPGESIQLIATLIQNGVAVEGNTVNVTVYYPGGTEYFSGNMTDMGSGIYIYNLSAPTDLGDYRTRFMTENTVKASSFSVSTLEDTMSSEHEETQKEIEDVVEDELDPINDFVSEAREWFNTPNFNIGMLLVTIILLVLIVIGLRKVFNNNEKTNYEVNSEGYYE